MWDAALILLLWAADKHLLSKVWNLISSGSVKVAYSALNVYSNWRSDMIEDGYHVNEVYLIERSSDPSEPDFREIDVLRIFRQHINKLTFTNTKSISLKSFIELCCDPHSNFKEYDSECEYELVVKYTFDHRDYTIVYAEDENGKGGHIRFPIYSIQSIHNRELKKTGVITAAQLTAKEDDDDGIDIYTALKELAGPMENFYADTEYTIKKHHLRHVGLRVRTDSMYIQMLDFWGSRFVISPDQDTLKLEKK